VIAMFPARPTTYNGIPMRSRLEARFAADMDRQSAVWVYEPRAYASPDGQYLPDFQILEYGGKAVQPPLFFEVRPTVERAYLAMERMAIIWASEPTADLCIAVPGQLCFYATGDERVWRAAT
jgi:hypothetical protein